MESEEAGESEESGVDGAGGGVGAEIVGAEIAGAEIGETSGVAGAGLGVRSVPVTGA